MNLFFLILQVIGAIVLAQFFIGPVVVFFSQKMPETFRFNLLKTEEFLAERTATFKHLHDTIIAEGFEYVGSSEINHSHSTMYFSIYYNESLKLCCTLSTIHSADNQETTQIEFTQMYSDGSVLNINNNPIIDIYPKNDQKLSFRFPDINDFEQLLSIALKLISSHKTQASKEGFIKGQEFSTIEAFLNNEQDFLISKGWLSSIVKNQQRRLTIKGAILMTWQLCWPINKWLNKKEIWQAKRALQNA